MILALRTLKGAPLYTRHQTREGASVGYIHALFFDPGTAKLQKLQYRTGFFRCTWQTVKAEDLELVRGRVYVVSKPLLKNSLLKQEAVAYGGAQELFGLRVFTSSGIFVGVINDLYIDDVSLSMIQMEVAKKILGVPVVKLLITRQDVLDILPDKVIVRDAVLEEKDLLSLFLPDKQLSRVVTHTSILRQER